MSYDSRMSIQSPTIQFRPLPVGPEAVLQKYVEERLNALFPTDNRRVWSAGSPTLGAGRPDILHATYEPEILAIASKNIRARELLAYLRAVGRAKPTTISARTGHSLKTVEKLLLDLTESDIVIVGQSGYSLSNKWRSVLPEVTTIEVKVTDWRKALFQAARNQLFAHKSFVALPRHLALRVRYEELFRLKGIGLISISESGETKVIRKARTSNPKVWSYYYSLAFMAAEHLTRTDLDLHRIN